VPEEVAPLVRAINDLLARLDQSMSRQKHFLADAAHQLKTPLAGLRTQAELAQREIDAGSEDAKSLGRSLQQIAHSSQRAAHMVNQLLAMARAEARTLARQPETVNLVPASISRCASSACVRRPASGVFSWCAASARKCFCRAIDWSSRISRSLIARTSGETSSGASRSSIGLRSLLSRRRMRQKQTKKKAISNQEKNRVVSLSLS